MNDLPALTCDSEPIHAPGLVQGHGALLILEPNTLRVVSLSANAPLVLDRPEEAQDLLGRPLADTVSAAFAAALEQARAGLGGTPGSRAQFSLQNLVSWDVTLVVLDAAGHLGVEVTVARSAMPGDLSGAGAHAWGAFPMPEIFDDGAPLDALLQRACRAVRTVTGFDRVMVYRFLPGWHGEVWAEDKRADAQSFLGHRFPATDIPAPARALYLSNGVRAIPDALDPAVPLLSLPTALAEGKADLTHSRLRAVAPVHLEYMRNMGVRSSLSLALTNGGELWGLVACHGSRRVSLPQGDLAWCEHASHLLSKEITARDRAARDAHANAFARALANVLPDARTQGELCDRILSNPAELLAVFRADGFAWVQENKVDHVGFTPRRDDLVALTKAVKASAENALPTHEKTAKGGHRLALESLAGLTPKINARPSCGLLSVCVDGGVFLVFRNEVLREITWSGDPRKVLASRGFGGRINPRQSFEAYVETVEGHAVPWSSDEERAFQLFAEKLDSLPAL